MNDLTLEYLQSEHFTNTTTGNNMKLPTLDSFST